MLYQPKTQLLPGARLADQKPLPTLSVLGLPLVSSETERVIRTLLAPGHRTVFFFNAHCGNIRARHARYRAALDRADFILPDGIGVELAARMHGKQLAANLNGTDLTPVLLRRAAHMGKSVFLLGGTPGTANAAAQRLCIDIPGLRIAGARDGFDGVGRPEDALDEINGSGADILLVAMGVPIQELWIDAYRHRLNPSLVLGVGALFDFLAGNVQRAPRIVRRCRMEWAWRLVMEPRRMAKRYLIGNFTFLARAMSYAAKQVDAQRRLDILISGAALCVLGLPMLAIGGLVRLDSKGPAIFKQARVGKDGQTFNVYKFRSMHIDATARRAALLAQSDRKGICFKARNDPRVTRIGKILRRLSIDELPQLLNVLKGDMSIVGPRPALPEEVERYCIRALGRLAVKPGITGLWQVSGRANIGFEKMIDLDLAYIKARSTVLNLMLIALTFRAVLSGRGAY